MTTDFAYRVSTTRFDEDYEPAAASRVTTNFANLARGPRRRENLRAVLAMIDARFGELAEGLGPRGARWAVELDIVTVELVIESDGGEVGFPLLEVLDTAIVDRGSGRRLRGITGNNLSSYIRDYDFSVLLPAARAAGAGSALPEDFGDLHGRLFRRFVDSPEYRQRFEQPPVVCISVSTSTAYRRTGERHPVLGWEYRQDRRSPTDDYFARMGLEARFFMPPGGAAPLAFYSRGDLTSDRSALQLIGTISTMETFQKIYRPEIYAADAPAGEVYRPSLEHADFTPTAIEYDRVERSRLAVTQGRFAEEHLMRPYGAALARWAAARPIPTS